MKRESNDFLIFIGFLAIIFIGIAAPFAACNRGTSKEDTQTDISRISLVSYEDSKISIKNDNAAKVVCDILVGFKKQDALLEQYLAQNVTLKAKEKTEILYTTKIDPAEYDEVVILSINIMLEDPILANTSPTMDVGEKIAVENGWEQSGIVGELDDNGQYYFLASFGKEAKLFLMNLNSNSKEITLQYQLQYCDEQGNLLQESPVLETTLRYPYGSAYVNLNQGEYPKSVQSIKFKYLNATKKSFSFSIDTEHINLYNTILETKQQNPRIYNILGIEKNVLLQAEVYNRAYEYMGTVNVDVTLKPYEARTLDIPYTEEQKKALAEGGYMDWK